MTILITILAFVLFGLMALSGFAEEELKKEREKRMFAEYPQLGGKI